MCCMYSKIRDERLVRRSSELRSPVLPKNASQRHFSTSPTTDFDAIIMYHVVTRAGLQKSRRLKQCVVHLTEQANLCVVRSRFPFHNVFTMVIEAFPPHESADENGLLAIGGDLDVESLILAYVNGIFPWPIFEEDILAWFSPPRRALLFIDEVRLLKILINWFFWNSGG